MSRRKTFDPAAVPALFWKRGEVQGALARRDVGRLFQLYLAAFPECTQTQLALLTAHDRSDVSNFVRGARGRPVSDIEVLARIADGLEMPDDARVLLGLAPAEARISSIGRPAEAVQQADPPRSSRTISTGWYLPTAGVPEYCIAICGSRATDTDSTVIDGAIRSLGRLLMRYRCIVSHGPLGVGMEVMAHIADHYHPPNLDSITGVLGRHNVVRNAHYVFVVGGGSGTQDEFDLAISMGKKVIPMPASGGTARRAYVHMLREPQLRQWMADEDFSALEACADADEYVAIAERVLATDFRSSA